jgi:16S rRNA (cytosine1402-N4)-methyltransferase
MEEAVGGGVVLSPADDFSHLPVLLDEVIALLGGCRRVLDATAGGGGHSAALLARGAAVLALDKDPDAVAVLPGRLGASPTVLRLDFVDAASHPAVTAFRPDGVLLDLGVSSRQLDDASRGFTFRPGAPLDMRMSRDGRSAAEWLNRSDEEQLTRTFADYGDEPRARPLAREIVRRRSRASFATSDDLVNAIRAVKGARSGPADFARLFQAVRIAVNDELARLARALPAMLELLEPEGVMAVISYHSGEDRIVKRSFREWARACVCPPGQPVCACRGRPLGRLLTRRSVAPGKAELSKNPRSRSARLRGFRKAEG